MVTKWFKPKRHSGFSKDYTIDQNLRVMYANTSKALSSYKRWLRVGRQAQALANLTIGKPKLRHVHEKSRSVAEHAFKKASKYTEESVRKSNR